MKTLIGAVAGAFALGAVLVAYDLGARRAFNPYAAAMDPYAVQAGQAGYGSPYAQYASSLAAQYPYGVAAPTAPMAGYAAPQYLNQRVVTAQPAVRRVSTERAYATERVSPPKRSWQKSALLIGGSAAGGAGVGALIGGKKAAGIGALIGGGSAAIYDQVKRH